MSFARESFTIASPRSPQRRITVYQPDRRDQPRATGPLPLLLLHDGQNLFDPDRAHVAGEHWRVAETADALIADGRVPPMVIAGIDHAGDDRLNEFTPTSDGRPGAGQAATYGRFLMRDLVPYLARAYGVRTDRDGLAMGGSSLGGLVTLAIAKQYQGSFGRLLVMSPSVWWDRRAIVRDLRRGPFDPPPRVYLDMGRREGARVLADARALKTVLSTQTSALRYVEDPEGRHGEIDWARRLPDAMAWLFGGG